MLQDALPSNWWQRTPRLKGGTNRKVLVGVEHCTPLQHTSPQGLPVRTHTLRRPGNHGTPLQCTIPVDPPPAPPPPGRWRGALVAVKVLDHACNQSLLVARESVLSTALSHPNLVATYKICELGSREGEDTAVKAGSDGLGTPRLSSELAR